MSITFRELPDGYGVIGEVDLMDEARKRIRRKIEIDGEKALELALAEVGYIKERTCTIEHRRDEYVCTACGNAVGDDDPWSENFVNGNAVEMWAYCPHCGAKVTDDNGGIPNDEPNTIKFSCGHLSLLHDGEIPPEYCPDCGARVVD